MESGTFRSSSSSSTSIPHDDDTEVGTAEAVIEGLFSQAAQELTGYMTEAQITDLRNLGSHSFYGDELGREKAYRLHTAHQLQHIAETQQANMQLLEIADILRAQEKQKPMARQKISPDIEGALKHRRERGYYYDLYRISNASQLANENEYDTTF